jgi:hypothetical protein
MLNRCCKIFLAILAALCSVASRAEAPDHLISIGHPAIKWRLQFEMPSALEQYNNYKEGAGTYAVGRSFDGKTNFSMVLHRYPNANDAKSCRDSEIENIRKNPKLTDLKIAPYEDKDSASVGVSGKLVHQGSTYYAQHLHRFIFRDTLCGKVHISTVSPEASNGEGLKKLAESLALVDSKEVVVRSFRVGTKAALRVPMSSQWGFQTSDPQGELGRTITVRASDGSFQWMMTGFVSAEGKPQPDEDSVTKTVESAWESVAAGSTQTQLNLQTLSGDSVRGYYFFSTDKTLVGKPSVPGNWKHMRQGFARAGNALVSFTILSDDEKSPDALSALVNMSPLQFVPD